jgi:hypothetical protein
MNRTTTPGMKKHQMHNITNVSVDANVLAPALSAKRAPQVTYKLSLSSSTLCRRSSAVAVLLLMSPPSC